MLLAGDSWRGQKQTSRSFRTKPGRTHRWLKVRCIAPIIRVCRCW